MLSVCWLGSAGRYACPEVSAGVPHTGRGMPQLPYSRRRVGNPPAQGFWYVWHASFWVPVPRDEGGHRGVYQWSERRSHWRLQKQLRGNLRRSRTGWRAVEG